MSSILLDTNAYTGYLTGDGQVTEVMLRADAVLMSVIVLGELHAGFRGGTRHRENLELLEQFLAISTVRVLPVTRETSVIFGQVKDTLRRAGCPIPLNDVWLAAQAFEVGAVVVSHDTHFARVPGLRLWST